MQPPSSLSKALLDFDPGLRVRWAEALGLWCIERHHGFAGLERDAVLGLLYHQWKVRERASDAFPADMELERRERESYDAFISRRDRFQPILYLRSDQAEKTDAIILILFGMDIRRAGGPAAFAQQHKDAQERYRAVIRAQRRERLRALAERAFDEAASQKDFHAQGGDAFFYKWQRKS